MRYNSSDQLLSMLKPMEASNKVLIGIVEKMLEENPRDWHRILLETSWAYRTSKRSSIGVIPFSDLWTRYSNPNGSSDAVSKINLIKWPYSSRVQ